VSPAGEVPPQTPGKGEPSSPLDFSKRDWKATAKRTVKEIRNDRMTLIAASIAYYAFIAIFPALIAAVGVVSLVHLRPEVVGQLSGGIRQLLPGEAGTVLADAIGNAQGSGRGASFVAALVGLLVALWGASSAMVALQRGLDVVYDIPAERDRSFLKLRLVGLGLLVATAVLGGVASALIVFGRPIGEALRHALPLGDLFVVLWGVARWLAAILAIVTLFAAYYFVAPNRDTPRWTWITPGGVVATVIWIVASLGFSFYVSHFGKGYGRTYGSLAGVVLLILWLYFSSLSVLVGGEINAELERQAALKRSDGGDPRRGSPQPSGWRSVAGRSSDAPPMSRRR
jgi:membrane protein